MKGGVILTLILLVSFSFISAAEHSGTEIIISIDGAAKTLNEFSWPNYWFGSHSYTAASIPAAGHDASQIWVSVASGEMTLTNALSSPGKLCPASPAKTTYTSPSIPNPIHFATEITLASGKTLQQAINEGVYCCSPSTCASLGKNCGSYADGCGNTLSCGSCTGQYTCSSGVCTCVPSTCASLGKVGTTVSDGCGTTLCCAHTCASLGQQCGSWSNGCGGTVYCGSCSNPSEYYCNVGTCTYYSSGSSSSDTTSTEDTSHTNPFTGATGDYDGDGQTDSGSGGSSGGKLICTELYRQGLMDEEIYLADQEFGKSMKETHPEIMKGYTMFAIPIVEKMKESESFTQAVNVVVKPWSEEMAYKAGIKESGNFVGAVIMNVGMVIFWITGSLALGQLSLLFLAQMTIAVVVLVVSIYLNKNKRR